VFFIISAAKIQQTQDKLRPPNNNLQKK
jgi:hypothetical protein